MREDAAHTSMIGFAIGHDRTDAIVQVGESVGFIPLCRELGVRSGFCQLLAHHTLSIFLSMFS